MPKTLPDHCVWVFRVAFGVESTDSVKSLSSYYFKAFCVCSNPCSHVLGTLSFPFLYQTMPRTHGHHHLIYYVPNYWDATNYHFGGIKYVVRVHSVERSRHSWLSTNKDRYILESFWLWTLVVQTQRTALILPLHTKESRDQGSTVEPR